MCMSLLINHWARDSIGALELPLESEEDGLHLTVRQYYFLSGIYFLPNIVVPLLAGVVAESFGAARTLFVFLYAAHSPRR